MGITRIDDGTLMVLARTCEKPIDGAVLPGPRVPEGENAESSTITFWEIDRSAQSLSMEWPLLGPGIEGIESSAPLEGMPTPYYLELSGFRSSSFNAVGPAGFDAATLEALQVAEVLVTDPDQGVDKFTVVNTSDFETLASCGS